MKISNLILYLDTEGVSVFNLLIYSLISPILLIGNSIGRDLCWIWIRDIIAGIDKNWFDWFSGVINRLVYSFFVLNWNSILLELNEINFIVI
jgi:hypothetical protein